MRYIHSFFGFLFTVCIFSFTMDDNTITDLITPFVHKSTSHTSGTIIPYKGEIYMEIDSNYIKNHFHIDINSTINDSLGFGTLSTTVKISDSDDTRSFLSKSKFDYQTPKVYFATSTHASLFKGITYRTSILRFSNINIKDLLVSVKGADYKYDTKTQILEFTPFKESETVSILFSQDDIIIHQVNFRTHQYYELIKNVFVNDIPKTKIQLNNGIIISKAKTIEIKADYLIENVDSVSYEMEAWLLNKKKKIHGNGSIAITKLLKKASSSDTLVLKILNRQTFQENKLIEKTELKNSNYLIPLIE